MCFGRQVGVMCLGLFCVFEKHVFHVSQKHDLGIVCAFQALLEFECIHRIFLHKMHIICIPIIYFAATHNTNDVVISVISSIWDV